MKYTINPQVFEINPNLRFGIIIANQLTNTETSPQETERLRNAEENVTFP